MRLVTFINSADLERVGILQADNKIIDLSAIQPPPRFDVSNLLGIIAAGDDALQWLRSVAANGVETVSLASVRLLAPIPKLNKNIFCVGLNYLAHYEEGKANRKVPMEFPEHPSFFSKPPTTVNGPDADIVVNPNTTEKLDWEVELGVVIGKTGINIEEDKAMEYVFGYTVINDISARDIQRQHGNQWFKGKSLDGSCPMGPSIVTADEIDPADLHLICRVNGAIKQCASTKDMWFKIPRLIAELSRGLTLEAGDVIATGTPSGVGHARTPPEFLYAGDVVETEIAEIGILKNRIAHLDI